MRPRCCGRRWNGPSPSSGSSQGTGALRADLHHISEQVLGEIVAALIGLDGLDTPEGRAKFDTYYQDIDNGVRITWATANIERLAAIAAAALDRLVEDFVKPAADRRARLLEAVAVGDAEPDAVPTDLITLMLEHHDSYAGIDENLMAREIALFVTASITTLTNQLCYCVHHIEEWIGEHPDDEGRRTDGLFLSQCPPGIDQAARRSRAHAEGDLRPGAAERRAGSRWPLRLGGHPRRPPRTRASSAPTPSRSTRSGRLPLARCPTVSSSASAGTPVSGNASHSATTRRIRTRSTAPG